MRCSAEARTKTSTSQIPLRICVAVTPDTTAFTARARFLRAHAQETGLILVDPDPDRAARLHPVVVDVRGAGGGADKLGHPGGDRAHLIRLPSAHPVLERPSDRRAELERVDPPDDAREARSPARAPASPSRARAARVPW